MARPTYTGPEPVTLHRRKANPVFSDGEFLSWAAMEPNRVAIECSSQSYTTKKKIGKHCRLRILLLILGFNITLVMILLVLVHFVPYTFKLFILIFVM